jgi:peptide/nickel transport system substrate-binding protein
MVAKPVRKAPHAASGGHSNTVERVMTTRHLSRRGLFKAAATGVGAALASPHLAHHHASAAGPPGMLKVVLESEVVILDPHFTTAAITRTFGYHVYDTLFAMDDGGQIRPQMVEHFASSADHLRWTFQLRESLRWHDGAPVTANDCVASLRRWAPRDAMGRLLMASMQSLDVKDARTFELVLGEPFPLVLEVLGKPNAPVPFMLPERLARVPGDQRLTEVVGSGPFRFRPHLWKAGDRMQLDRNPHYVPRQEPPDFLAGGKNVRIDELNLLVLPDQVTASSALITGEIDYQQYVPFDMIGRLATARGVNLLGLGGLHMFQGNFRLNHAAPPFDDPAVRRVLWKLVDQASMLQAIGVPARYAVTDCTSFWMCGSPLETKVGAEAFRYSVDAARDELKATGYAGQPVVMLQVSGSISQTAAKVLAQAMRQAGFVVDEQVMDWGTVLARRAKKDGWGLFAVYSNGIDMISPLTHFYIANTCADYPGWSCDKAIPPLLAAFARAPGQAERRRIAEEIQLVAYDLTPAVSWGQFTIPAAYRASLVGLLQSSFPIFWEVSKRA